MLEWDELEKVAQENGMDVCVPLPAGYVLLNRDDLSVCLGSGAHKRHLCGFPGRRYDSPEPATYTKNETILLRDALIRLLPLGKYVVTEDIREGATNAG